MQYIYIYTYRKHVCVDAYVHISTYMHITDIFYKETNSHDYLNYFSPHPEHTKQNIPYNLAKRVMVFAIDEAKMNEMLFELKTWLLSCSYP